MPVEWPRSGPKTVQRLADLELGEEDNELRWQFAKLTERSKYIIKALAKIAKDLCSEECPDADHKLREERQAELKEE